MKNTSNKLYEFLKKNIAIAFTVLGIAIGIFINMKEHKTEVTYEVMHELDVFSLNSDVKDLEILFRKKNIIKHGLNLKLLYILITNNGDKNLKIEDFDKTNPWRIEIVNNKSANEEAIKDEIVRVSPLTPDSNLREALKKIKISEGSVKIPFFMFDKNKFFVLKILVSHKKETPINIVMRGKISGMDDFIHVIESFKKTGIWSKALQGGIIIQLIRIVVYFLGIFITLILLGYFIERHFEKQKNAN